MPDISLERKPVCEERDVMPWAKHRILRFAAFRQGMFSINLDWGGNVSSEILPANRHMYFTFTFKFL